ncbi:LysR family substrate-binding domain-containing protein [Pseudomonas helleri]|uniref:LysR substrate-binding domain-containing protein n=2 Tax=Pseudomonadati TaxID=3379134 RepID=A0A7X1XCI8_9PSED|nr:LysR family substrate-binding domain-containing protein [Pseudomonas helleri]MQT89055.1 hypothetical protein [Pseudomonas helleri]
MLANSKHRPLRIALSFGALHARLATLLARQRVEEPETSLTFTEVFSTEQCTGLMDSRYDLGFSLEAGSGHGLSVAPLWHDELAVAVPVRSPLLAYPAIPLPVLAEYPLVMWHPEACAAMHQRVASVLAMAAVTPQIEAHARSFSFITALVAAGYGIGLAARSWIDAARSAGVVARPFAEGTESLTTYLLSSRSQASSETLRFIERALASQGSSAHH